MPNPTLAQRIHGSLIGAAIGAELSFARARHPERVAKRPEDFAALIPQLGPATAPPEKLHWMTDASLRHLVDAGVAAYVKKQGRATPEDFAEVFKDHAGIATPALFFDNLHTVQELLKEGMHPRLSGLGNAPHGLMCAAMPAVGIYHLADPDYAYLDGIELAAVGQGREGSEWAGLCAAAVAAAFAPDATARSVTDTVLRLAQENDKNEMRQLYWPTRIGRSTPRAEFAEWWWRDGGYVPVTSAQQFIAWNPPRYLLPLIDHCADQPELFMAYLTGAAGNWYYGQNGLHGAVAVTGGAILGALGGPEIFPARWRAWAEPLAEAWRGLGPVVERRLAE
ncbi:MAG: ADP-ribosylglycohydrolase family protein, partial [Verrucomicrobia bacterium]|nr:ADP-ribosylglycohydrolase family protein [Verrucomicrobiota bacterium]